MTFEELRTANITRCERWHPGGILDWDLSQWAVAAAGEMGEACNVVKKLNRSADGISGNDKNDAALQAQLAEEIADTVIYLDLMAARAGIDLAQAVVDKFNKVSEKYGFPDRL